MSPKNIQQRTDADVSMERYLSFLETSQEGIWRIELDEPVPVSLPAGKQIKLMYEYGYLAECNKAMAKMYGFSSPKSLLGAKLGDLLVESDPKNTKYLTAFVTSKYKLSGVESHEKDRNGNDKYFRNSLTGIVENGMLLRAWGTQQDITDQHTAIAERLRSQTHLKLALKASHLGTWEWEVESKNLVWSDELKRLFGLDPKEVITFVKFKKMIHPEDRERLFGAIDQAMKSGKPYGIEHRVIWPDKSVHWLLGQGQAIMKNGKPEYMLGTALGIDDRKQFEFRIVESEQRFRTVADTAPVLIWMADTDMKCTYFNKPWLQFTGRTLKQERGDGWKRSIHPEDLDRCIATYAASFKKRQPYSMEYRLRYHDGTYRQIVDRGIPRYSPAGKFMGYIGSCTDIEDIKQATRRSTELELKNHRLEQVQQELLNLSSAKDDFISIASHQLRTPATGVKQYVGMVLEGFAGPLADEQRAMLDAAYQSNERQIHIVNDLLKVAQIDSGKLKLNRKPVDVSELLHDIVREQRSKFAMRSQQLLVQADEGIACELDEFLIRMVIENLVDNASKYSKHGSVIRASLTPSDSEITISISDDGYGIYKKDIEKLFQKFSRIENRHTSAIEGTGLGLYWSRIAVEKHGGTITVDSKPGKGTTFSVHLPYVKLTG